jgi:hypothetical protein
MFGQGFNEFKKFSKVSININKEHAREKVYKLGRIREII